MKKDIVRHLQNAGGRLTRVELWGRLELSESGPTDTYWVSEQDLVDDKRIERRRGRYGGIFLLPDKEEEQYDTTLDTVPIKAAEQEHQKESYFYQPVLNEILAHWTEQPGFEHVFGAVTAAQGRRQTGGRWSRPDIVFCTVSDWLFSSRA